MIEKKFEIEIIYVLFIYFPSEKTGVVLWQLKEWIESTPDVYVHFPVEVRFVRAENIFLSPAFGRNTCYINIIMYR